ncbi:MAG: beta-ketoacyl synthase N-terminal-like domain-containing protein, partial [Myxococcota bacterium]|nr:beta-ketoacyl synthase N-terminal-like domain-containing protein [Myxococcota bacterium]
MTVGPVAIVGRACVLPGATSPEALWELVRAGRSAVTSAPEGRWRLNHDEILCGLDEDSRDRAWSDKGGYVQEFQSVFDPRGFAVPPEHFEGLDRLFLWTVHTAREALRDAGDERQGAVDRSRVGAVFGNLSFPSVAMSQLSEATWFETDDAPDPRNRFTSSGPARLLEEALGLGAGTFCLDAACASSLYAIKLACDRLDDGLADVMLAGAVNCADDLFIHVGFCALQAMSRTGQSRPFHAGADGLVPAEGAGFVTLKRLADAERDGDRILGVIRGVGLSNDGRGSGLLAPSDVGQARAIRQAYEVSGVDPTDVSLLECHATGTPVGDGVEIRSSASVFGSHQAMPIGSLKSNLGHLVTAAGVAGLIKVIEAMRHGERPPTIGADEPTPALEGSPFRLLTRAEPWECEGPRIAGISAFGFGGNNAHLVVSEYRAEDPTLTHTRTDPVPVPVAVVGIGATVGTARGRAALTETLVQGRALAAREQGDDTRTSTIPVALSGLRFPPRDLQQSLAQQVMVLEAAREAVADAGLTLSENRTGVLVGMEADPEIGRYGARWRMGEHARALGASDAWRDEARDGVVASLDAAGVVGNMPNIPANRLNSQLNLGGPGFTLSAGSDSGLVALELAARALREGELDACVVGAVDLSCEPVHQTAARTLLPAGHQLPADAAVVLVLQRLEDAREQGARIYAVLDAPGAQDACLQLGAGADGSALRERMGHAFAADSLVHAAVGSLSLHRRVRPDGLPWLPPTDGTRSARITGSRKNGESREVVLREAPGVRGEPDQPESRLYVYGGADREAVLSALAQGRQNEDGPSRLVIVAADQAEHAQRADRAIKHLQKGAPAGRGVHFRDAPIEGELALVFTGAGAAYRGMGAELLTVVPQLADRVQQRFTGLGQALAWAYDPAMENQRPTELQQLWGASALCQVHAELSMGVLGLRPDAVIGYSSGETNSLYALGIWSDLDQMVAQSESSQVFTREIGGEFGAVSRSWGEPAQWACWMVMAPREEVDAALVGEPRLHLSIIHCPGDYVVAGDQAAADRFVERIGRGRCVRLGYELAVHVPELDEIRQTWLDLHTRAVTPCPDVRVYSNAHHGPYEPSEQACAEAILQQANSCLDLSATIERAWSDGVRVFVEHGPQALCGRWIREILGDREAVIVSLDRRGQGLGSTLDAVAALVAAGVSADHHALQALLAARPAAPAAGHSLEFRAHPPLVRLPSLPTVTQESVMRDPSMPPAPALPSVASSAILGDHPLPGPLPAPSIPVIQPTTQEPLPPSVSPALPAAAAPIQPAPAAPMAAGPGTETVVAHPLVATHQQQVTMMAQAQRDFVAAQSELHQKFLQVRRNAMFSLLHGARVEPVAPTYVPGVESIPPTPALLEAPQPVVPQVVPQPVAPQSIPQPAAPQPAPTPAPAVARQAPAPAAPVTPEVIVPRAEKKPVAKQAKGRRAPIGPTLDRAQLEIHAGGAISEVYGPMFEPQDGYTRQVRMPMPPLLLADRMTGIDAEQGSMGLGTIWTETDVTWDSWYLHQGTMPPGIMIESGQADLMLISWLGVDLHNKGERVYRLLGCELTYHGELPRPGETLEFDIHVDGHANQGPIRLMFFHYDCVVDGEPRLTVRHGQAGFFTDEELADSAGCLWTPEEQELVEQPRLDPAVVVCEHSAFTNEQVRAFSEGRTWECFGNGFEGTQCHERTPRIQDGRMMFLEQITDFSTDGGPWKRGYLRAETEITPEAWFFDGHFKNDPCMPGTLMFEGCLQAMSFYLAAMGFTVARDGWRFQPVAEEPFQLRCRGQVIPSSSKLVYEVFVEEVVGGPVPTLYADLLCTVDGLKAFHARRVALELVPDWPMSNRPELTDSHVETKPVAMSPEGFPFDYASLLACAWGRPSAAFGPIYERFDGPRQVARLPGPPYHFITRVTRAEGAMGQMEPGSLVEVEYDIPEDAWYFDANGCRSMPYAVLLEAALQPCGWLASYVGSALTVDSDLCFRNLDGTSELTGELFQDAGTLRTVSKLKSISQIGGMIIESFEVECFLGDVRIYTMDTVFGFFPGETMVNQVGLTTTDEQRSLLTDPCDTLVDLTDRGGPLFAEDRPGLPEPMLLMLDRITGLWPEGGEHGKGRIRGEKDVDQAEWFFKAHFFQDPVQPGSLGIEAMVQILQLFMLETGMDEGIDSPRFEPMALGRAMTWKYRGQVVPSNKVISTTMDIVDTGTDERGTWAVADTSLWVDGKRIYEASNLGMRIVSGATPGPGKGAKSETETTVLDPRVDTWLGDHRPTWTVPALPMMSMVDLLAQGAAGQGPVTELRDVRVKGWMVVDQTRTLRTEVDGQNVRLLADGEDGEIEVATARVVQGDYPQAPEALPAIEGETGSSPYDTGALFHGPAFQVLQSLVTSGSGASSV